MLIGRVLRRFIDAAEDADRRCVRVANNQERMVRNEREVQEQQAKEQRERERRLMLAGQLKKVDKTTHRYK